MIEYDEAKMDSYYLSGDEVDQFDLLIRAFLSQVEAKFEDRAPQVLANCLGNALAHTLLDHDEAFYVMTRVNEWLALATKNHRGLPLQLQFDDDLISASSRAVS